MHFNIVDASSFDTYTRGDIASQAKMSKLTLKSLLEQAEKNEVDKLAHKPKLLAHYEKENERLMDDSHRLGTL